MPISVICPGCHARFQVADKYGGKEGPCPKCKVKITIPKVSDEIKVHAPVHSEAGAKDSKGRAVLKPLTREEVKFSPVMFATVAGGVALTFGLAYMLGPTAVAQPWMLVAGLVVISPVLASAAYSFLRNDELAPFTGKELVLRSLVCGLLYAAMWVAYVFIPMDWKQDAAALYVAAPFLAIGAAIAFACMDFDFGTGLLHYGFYLIVTLVLCLVTRYPLWSKAPAPQSYPGFGPPVTSGQQSSTAAPATPAPAAK